MSKVSIPLLGKASGSMGGVTFSSWKGTNVMKTKATTVANPQSDKQKAQRAAFSFIVALYRMFVSVLKLGFKEMAIGKSEFNAFMAQNIKTAFDFSAPPAAPFVPTNFKCSKGTISDSALSSVDWNVGETGITFAFPTTANLPGQSLTDKALVMAYNETQQEWAGLVAPAMRSTGTVTLITPETWVAGDDIHTYLGFVNADGSKCSDSVYTAIDND